MDSVEIRGLTCRCIIGIRARERRVAQPVRLNIKLEVELERAGKSGRIAHTVDYSRASTELIALLQFRRYLLLEVAAEECTGWLFAAHPAIKAVTLSIEKPRALAGQAESGGVTIERRRPLETQRSKTEFGFVEQQLETSEASIVLVSLQSGASFTPRALGAASALLVPLAACFETSKSLIAHTPTRLHGSDACHNRDGSLASLVVCAARGSLSS
jgi:dihydroneopterin aldolase